MADNNLHTMGNIGLDLRFCMESSSTCNVSMWECRNICGIKWADFVHPQLLSNKQTSPSIRQTHLDDMVEYYIGTRGK